MVRQFLLFMSSKTSADKIIVLNHGSIESIGTHKTLIKKDGIYKRIWEIQTSLDALDDEKQVCNE